METQQESPKAVHPLMAKEIRWISDWSKWKKYWEKESQAEILHSLLHFGFDVDARNTEEAIERICLYLDIADGCFCLDTFYVNFREDHSGPRWVDHSKGVRRALSEKAFQTLCQKFFKDSRREGYSDVPSWVPYAAVSEIFSKLLRFFRVDKRGNISNLRGEGHNVEIARTFAAEFCFLAWKCDDYPPYYQALSDEVAETFRQAKPQMLEIMWGLGKLDFLLKSERYRTLDEKCEQKLEELALSLDGNFPDGGRFFRKPKTVDEACYANSQAARVLILLRIMRDQESHFGELRDLTEQSRIVEQRIKELNQ